MEAAAETNPVTSKILEQIAAADAETDSLLAELFKAGAPPADILSEFAQIKTAEPIVATVEKARAVRRSIWRDNIEPPTFDQFCIDLDGCALFPRQYQAFASTEMLSPYAILSPRDLHQWVLVFGKGSGKDYMVAKFISWIFLVLCYLDGDPATHLGLAPYSRLSIINVASTKEQARNVFFAQYLARFLKHKMFDRFLRAGNGVAALGKTDANGKENADMIVHYRTSPEGIKYECIGIYSMHSRAASLEGHNVFSWVMDEADAFLDSADKSNAQFVYDTLRSSSQRFQKHWIGMIISYPRTKEGFMMRLHEKAAKRIAKLGKGAGYYTDLAASWEVNPNFDKNNPDVVEMFETDFARANAMYGCIPMEAVDAFFEFPEKLEEAIDYKRAEQDRVAVVMEETLDIPLQSGSCAYYVTGKVSNIRPIPGHVYFLGGDAGHKKDGYALAVWHYDASSEGAEWLCPSCADYSPMARTARYIRQGFGTRVAASFGNEPTCGACMAVPSDITGTISHGTVNVADWLRLESAGETWDMEAGGTTLKLPRLYEDLLVTIEARKAKSADKNHESGRNRLIYFPGVREICKQLVQQLPITQGRFDPWQTIEITQGLITDTGADISEISFSNPEQYRRAKFFKRMLYSGYLSLLPNERRDKEIKRLERVGDYRVDHPEGGSKDAFDVSTICTWTAALHKDNRLEMLFL